MCWSFLELCENAALLACSNDSVEGIGGIFRGGASEDRARFSVSSLPVGRRGGREGRGGGAGLTCALTGSELGAVVDCGRPAYLGCSSEALEAADGFGLRTGRGGRGHSPHAGAFTLLSESVDFVRIAEIFAEGVSLVLLEMVDATEPLLCSSRAELRVGSGGGCRLARGGGGAGRLLGRVSETEPLTCSEGLLKVLCLTTTGRLEEMGGW